MKFVSNAGQERVIDLLRQSLPQTANGQLGVASPAYSLFAFGEMLADTAKVGLSRLILPHQTDDLALLGSSADRSARNRLQGPWLAKQFAQWIEAKAEVRRAQGPIPQGAFVTRDSEGQAQQALMGSFSFSTDALLRCHLHRRKRRRTRSSQLVLPRRHPCHEG